MRKIIYHDDSVLFCEYMEYIGAGVMLCDDIYEIALTDIVRIETAEE